MDPGAVAAARARLQSSGRFSSVEIRQRGRSIADPTRVALISLVTELAAVRPVVTGVPDIPGLLGRLAGRLQIDAVDAPLPAYAKPILGGADTLRGIRAGHAVGDNLWSASVEARAPFTSVLRSTRLGVLAFYDTGATWDYGTGWRDAVREEGVGAGVFLVNPFVQLQLSVARGLGRSTRVHVRTGVSF